VIQNHVPDSPKRNAPLLSYMPVSHFPSCIVYTSQLFFFMQDRVDVNVHAFKYLSPILSTCIKL